MILCDDVKRTHLIIDAIDDAEDGAYICGEPQFVLKQTVSGSQADRRVVELCNGENAVCSRCLEGLKIVLIRAHGEPDSCLKRNLVFCREACLNKKVRLVRLVKRAVRLARKAERHRQVLPVSHGDKIISAAQEETVRGLVGKLRDLDGIGMQYVEIGNTGVETIPKCKCREIAGVYGHRRIEVVEVCRSYFRLRRVVVLLLVRKAQIDPAVKHADAV